MKNNRKNKSKVIVNGELDLNPVSESLMDVFFAAIIKLINKLNNKHSNKGATDL